MFWGRCQIKLGWSGQGAFVASVNDKKIPISMFYDKPLDFPELYVWLSVSIWNVEDLPYERGIYVSYETDLFLVEPF